MGRNNQRRKMIPEQRNFKLYKHKKQWMTACATFLLTFGATAVMNVSASANTDNTSNGGSTPKTAEVVKAAVNSSQEQPNNAQPVTETSADTKEQTATASSAGQSTTNKETAAKSKRKLQRPNQLKRKPLATPQQLLPLLPLQQLTQRVLLLLR